MTNCIDTAMDRVQATRTNSVTDPVLVQSRRAQLRHRHRPVLFSRDPRDNQVRRGASVAHIATKSPRPTVLPPECGLGV